MMNPSKTQTALATRCLWALQEAATDVEGLLLAHVDGLTLTSTLDGSESTQRLAAIATAMFLLGEQASEAWGRGESTEVTVRLLKDDAPEREYRFVYMKPVGYQAVLVAVCKSSHYLDSIKGYLNEAAVYLERVLDGQRPAPPKWNL